MPQTDWLDSYDQFLFGELDRVQFLRAFMWDVTLAGATEDDVKKKAKEIRPPKPGSVRVHNDAETWKAESPNIEAADTDTTAKLLRNHVLGGATIPEHWFGGAGDVNRATGEDMSGPTFKVMSMRQAYIGFMLVEVGRYVIRQWELAHNQTEPDLTDPIYDLCVHWPEMVAKDTTKYAAALQQVTTAVSQAIQARLLSRKTGLEIIEAVAGRLGVAFDAEAELLAIEQDGANTHQGINGNKGKANGSAEAAGSTAEASGGLASITEAVNSARPITTSRDGGSAGTVGNRSSEPLAAISDPPGDRVGLLSKTAQPTIDAMLETIKAMLDSARDLPDALDKLAGLFPELDATDLADILAQAIVASHLAGSNDVTEGR